MAKIIIYRNSDSGVSVIYPSPEAIEKYGIEAIAQKDVPSGIAYKIIDDTDLPERTFRNAWEVDESILTDGVGAESNEFPQ